MTTRPSTARRFARALRLGPVARHLYHTPRALLLRAAREGPVNIWLASRGRTEMEAAAVSLPSIAAMNLPSCDGLPATFLTGSRFWYQTVFCAHSLMRSARAAIPLSILDDGSLEPRQVDEVLRLFPIVNVVPRAEIEVRLDEVLPASRFPTLRARRIVYPHLRKLTDVHAGLQGWRVVFDSDMFFWRRPDFVLAWMKRPKAPLHMIDIADAYGYSRPLMRELCGHEVASRLNVGICGIASEDIDWDRLEHWARVATQREGGTYFQEQALTAMLMAGRACAVAPEMEYICHPGKDEVVAPKGVLHHYVGSTKNEYFRFAWRRYMASLGGAAR